MAHKTLMEPPYVSKLTKALRQGIPGAQIDREQIRRDRYRFVVVSQKFHRMGHPERQQLVWDIADKALNTPELLKVGMILTISPKELPTY